MKKSAARTTVVPAGSCETTDTTLDAEAVDVVEMVGLADSGLLCVGLALDELLHVANVVGVSVAEDDCDWLSELSALAETVLEGVDTGDAEKADEAVPDDEDRGLGLATVVTLGVGDVVPETLAASDPEGVGDSVLLGDSVELGESEPVAVGEPLVVTDTVRLGLAAPVRVDDLVPEALAVTDKDRLDDPLRVGDTDTVPLAVPDAEGESVVEAVAESVLVLEGVADPARIGDRLPLGKRLPLCEHVGERLPVEEGVQEEVHRDAAAGD